MKNRDFVAEIGKNLVQTPSGKRAVKDFYREWKKVDNMKLTFRCFTVKQLNTMEQMLFIRFRDKDYKLFDAYHEELINRQNQIKDVWEA